MRSRMTQEIARAMRKRVSLSNAAASTHVASWQQFSTEPKMSADHRLQKQREVKTLSHK